MARAKKPVVEHLDGCPATRDEVYPASSADGGCTVTRCIDCGAATVVTDDTPQTTEEES